MAQKLFKVKAATLEEAYDRMRRQFGDDAIVLNTRQAVEGGVFGLFGKRVVEVTVSVTEGGPTRERSVAEKRYAQHAESPRAAAPQRTAPLPAPAPDNLKYLEDLVRQAQQRMNARPAATAQAPTQHNTPDAPVTYARPAAMPASTHTANAHTNAQAATAPVLQFPARKAEDDPVRKELNEIRGMLQVLYAENPGAGLPTEFAPHYRRLVQQGVSRRIAAELTAAVLKDSDPTILRDPRVFGERLQFEIRKLIHTTGGAAFRPGQPRRIALCGSTGVGKTTNLAKLAAHFAVRERARAALITTDTYRVAAVDQLRVYANIIGLPLRVANDPREALTALKEFHEHDLILVDTAGGSHFNLEQINELKTMLTGLQPDETYLVLSAATPLEDMRNAISNFRCLNPTALLFTKIDETRQYGALFSATLEAGLPIAYLSTGQNVPEDLLPATPAHIVHLLMEGKLPRA
jgi:flagellar biosynthesis protein FlhF